MKAMSGINPWKSKIVKISRFLLAPLEAIPQSGMPFRYPRKGLLMGLVSVLITAWLFFGWPRIWQNPPFPPEVKEVQANPGWLTGYSYRKAITITGQTGAGTNYQVKLLVGESAGAEGENFVCAWFDNYCKFNLECNFK